MHAAIIPCRRLCSLFQAAYRKDQLDKTLAATRSRQEHSKTATSRSRQKQTRTSKSGQDSPAQSGQDSRPNAVGGGGGDRAGQLREALTSPSRQEEAKQSNSGQDRRSLKIPEMTTAGGSGGDRGSRTSTAFIATASPVNRSGDPISVISYRLHCFGFVFSVLRRQTHTSTFFRSSVTRVCENPPLT